MAKGKIGFVTVPVGDFGRIPHAHGGNAFVNLLVRGDLKVRPPAVLHDDTVGITAR